MQWHNKLAENRFCINTYQELILLVSLLFITRYFSLLQHIRHRIYMLKTFHIFFKGVNFVYATGMWKISLDKIFSLICDLYKQVYSNNVDFKRSHLFNQKISCILYKHLNSKTHKMKLFFMNFKGLKKNIILNYIYVFILRVKIEKKKFLWVVSKEIISSNHYMK